MPRRGSAMHFERWARTGCIRLSPLSALSLPTEYGDIVADIMTKASIKAGNVLGFRIPVESEAKIGKTWLDTH